MTDDQISTLLSEDRRFPPPATFAQQANAQPELYAAGNADPLAFWADQARSLDWYTPWDTVLEWDLPMRNGSPAGRSMRRSTASIGT